jgi:hypothetical protein
LPVLVLMMISSQIRGNKERQPRIQGWRGVGPDKACPLCLRRCQFFAHTMSPTRLVFGETQTPRMAMPGADLV